MDSCKLLVKVGIQIFFGSKKQESWGLKPPTRYVHYVCQNIIYPKLSSFLSLWFSLDSANIESVYKELLVAVV